MAWGAVEIGGTWTRVATSDDGVTLSTRTRFPTGSPDRCLEQIVETFAHGPPVEAVGVASFGPVRLERDAADWGHVLDTPKPGWSGVALGPTLEARLGRTVAIETDVGAAALGEWHHGAGRGARCVAYITVGTGVGVGVVCGGRVLHGAVHPEAGHLYVPPWPPAAGRPGVCAFHGDCIEGRIAGPALARRYGVPAPSLGAGHPAWEDVEHNLAHLAHALRCVASADRIVLGGGVLRPPGLGGRVAARLARLDGGYAPLPSPGSAVQMAACDGQQALLGALSLLRTS